MYASAGGYGKKKKKKRKKVKLTTFHELTVNQNDQLIFFCAECKRETVSGKCIKKYVKVIEICSSSNSGIFAFLAFLVQGVIQNNIEERVQYSKVVN